MDKKFGKSNINFEEEVQKRVAEALSKAKDKN